MKQTLTGLLLMAFVTHAFPALAAKVDYCAAYARDFADAQTHDKTIWQHKYDIANAACLAEPQANAQVIKAKPIVKKPTTKLKIAVPAEPEATPASASAKPKLEPGSENWNSYCANKYTSFNAKTGTYTSHTGVERKCVVSYP